MTRKRIWLTIVITVSFVPALLNFFSVSTSAGNTSVNPDAIFLQQAANGASWIILMGELAEKQAASGDIQKYAKQITADNRIHVREIHHLAGKKGVLLSTDADQVQQNTFQYFSRQYGADFDRNYISMMADENSRQVSIFKLTAQKGIDEEIRAFAAAKIRMLEGYVAWAEKILSDLPKPVLK